MLIVNKNNSIELTRGDTARLTIDLTDDYDQPYEMQPEDTLIFTVKISADATEAVIEKELKGTNLLHLEPKDTAGLDYVKYVYDVEIHTADGDIYTVIEKTDFKLREEVTRR